MQEIVQESGRAGEGRDGELSGERRERGRERGKKFARMVSTERVRSSSKKVGRRAGKGNGPAAESGREMEV